MKKLVYYITITLIALGVAAAAITVTACSIPTQTQYLRIHVRANSDGDEDQAVKYKVKDAIVQYLTPQLEGVSDVESAMDIVENNLCALEELSEYVLTDNGYFYGASVRLCREEFPARTYGSLTLESGVYDALIVELGSGQGDNWWCVVFPPLCFVSDQKGEFAYKSKIAELWNKYIRPLTRQ